MPAFIRADMVQCDGWRRVDHDYYDYSTTHVSCQNHESKTNIQYKILTTMSMSGGIGLVPEKYDDGWHYSIGEIQCPECQKKERSNK